MIPICRMALNRFSCDLKGATLGNKRDVNPQFIPLTFIPFTAYGKKKRAIRNESLLSLFYICKL